MLIIRLLNDAILFSNCDMASDLNVLKTTNIFG